MNRASNPAGTAATDTYPVNRVTGVVLAGGRARRMDGRDKGLIPLNGTAMIGYVLAVLRPQVGSIIINANRNIEAYAAFGCEVVADITDGYLGPLAGMASALRVATTPYVLTVPCDSPLIGSHLARRLYTALAAHDSDISVAHDGRRLHPVFALLRRDLLPSLLSYLDSGERKIDTWFARHRYTVADFSDTPDAFINVNSPDERVMLEKKLSVRTQC